MQPPASPATPASYRESLGKARADWRASDPRQAAANVDAIFLPGAGGQSELHLAYFGQTFAIAHPSGAIAEADSRREAGVATQILLLHHLLTADGVAPTGEWVSFHDLPDGRIYQTSFQARSLAPLSARFGADGASFARAGESLGGAPMRLGDVSFWFRAFPRLAVAAVLWLGEEDLPGSVNVLFDSAASHYLPSEDLAVLGGTFSGRLLRAGGPAAP
jgi:hypothetical protein